MKASMSSGQASTVIVLSRLTSSSSECVAVAVLDCAAEGPEILIVDAVVGSGGKVVVGRGSKVVVGSDKGPEILVVDAVVGRDGKVLKVVRWVKSSSVLVGAFFTLIGSFLE